MKNAFTTALLIGFITLLAAGSLLATTPGAIENTAHENVRREIIRYISCPAFITQNSDDNQIKAVISVDENGKVKIEQINSANVQLKNYVFAQLDNLKIRNTGSADRFMLVIKFKAD